MSYETLTKFLVPEQATVGYWVKLKPLCVTLQDNITKEFNENGCMKQKQSKSYISYFDNLKIL